jgi:YVTN family beta-propeller protein
MIMKIVYAVLLALCVFFTCSFDSCLTPATPGTPAGGFPVTTYSVTEDEDGNILSTGVVPYTEVSGNWVSGGTGGSATSFGVNSPFLTDENGNGFVNNGVVNADWTTTVGWPSTGCPSFSSPNTGTTYVNPINGIAWTCIFIQDIEEDNTSTHYALSGAAPSTITAYGDFMTTYGDPGLRVYVGGSTPSLVNVMSATSTVPEVSAVFPFPTQSNGSTLAKGFYGLVSTSVNSAGNAISTGSPSYLAVGGATTLSGAYGVDAGYVHYNMTTCILVLNSRECASSTSNLAVPVFTQYYANQISYSKVSTSYPCIPLSATSATLAVGSEPVAVKLYGAYSISCYYNENMYGTVTAPGQAIVANLGSSSVSIVSFATNTTLANIAVGGQPMAIALNSADTMAYVASYGNGTLAAINLSSNTLAGTATGLAGAQSVAMDPSGSYVWVGGTNYLYKVSVSSLAVVETYPVSGQVTSLAASNAQNELVYTLVENCCSASSKYSANEVSISTMTNTGTHASASASPYAAYTMNGTLPSAATLPQATVVSAQFSNGMAASATPTGFVVYDLEGHTTLMTGTTPTPVRGIAADPNCMFAYFTVPDSNEYIVVPLESQ